MTNSQKSTRGSVSLGLAKTSKSSLSRIPTSGWPSWVFAWCLDVFRRNAVTRADCENSSVWSILHIPFDHTQDIAATCAAQKWCVWCRKIVCEQRQVERVTLSLSLLQPRKSRSAAPCLISKRHFHLPSSHTPKRQRLSTADAARRPKPIP